MLLSLFHASGADGEVVSGFQWGFLIAESCGRDFHHELQRPVHLMGFHTERLTAQLLSARNGLSLELSPFQTLLTDSCKFQCYKSTI